jgi:hypothetical protein
MWRRIVAYAFFGLGFLTVTFFRSYTGNLIPYPFLFWVIGLVMFWVGFLFLRTTLTTKQMADRNKLKQLIDELKTTGQKIDVSFDNCEIKEHNYTEEQNIYGHENDILTLGVEHQMQGLNALGNDRRNVKQVHVYQSVIVFRYNNTRNGKTERFMSRVIPKDKLSLSFYLDNKKQTTLYIDKTNREKYYFDLDFLNE